MAIKKTWTIKFGDIDVSVQDAYCKVTNVSGDKKNVTATIDVFKDSLCSKSLATHIVSFEPALDGANFIAQSYEHFKTLPEFVGAQDC